MDEITSKVLRYSIVFMKGAYLFHFVPRLLGVAAFTYYDTNCAAYENASIFDCAQEFPVGSPKDWILFWLVSSILSCFAFYFISCSHGPKRHTWKTFKNMYVWILMLLFFITFASFSIRFINTELKDMALFLALLFWWPSTIAHVIYLNNQPPPQDPFSKSQCSISNELQETGSIEIIARPCNQTNQSNPVWFYFVYYTSLVIRFLECCAMACAIAIDAYTMSISGVIHGDVHGFLLTLFIKFFLPMRGLCITAIIVLYIQKLLHGNRTLFSEPGEPLEPVKDEVTTA